MKLGALDPIILGHNPFFGVDHLSQEKGAERNQNFANTENILNIVHYSLENGVKAMMMSTHPRAKAVCSILRKEKNLKNNLNIYPVLPYIQKYVRLSNEKGMVNVVLDSLANAKISQKLNLIIKGSKGFLKKDQFSILETLIDIELLIFNKLNNKVVFLHQALTDLALGLDFKNIFEFYIEYIEKKYGIIPAFCTYNLPLLVAKFKDWNIKDPVIMAPFNKMGFKMNPSLEENEECLRNNNVNLVAMGTLASGHLKPKDAYEYLFSLPNIASVVVGVSTKEHANETFDIIKHNFRKKNIS